MGEKDQPKDNSLLFDVAGLFGLKPRVDRIRAGVPPAEATQDPRAIAELDGSLIISERREQMAPPQQPPTRITEPVDADGNVDFASVYALARVPQAQFSAESAADAIDSVEKSIPDAIPEAQRAAMIRAMMTSLGKSLGGATPESVALDAHNKQQALHDFVRSRGNTLVDVSQKLDEMIAALKQQIEAHEQTKARAQKQHDSLTKNCKEEYDRLDKVIDLFSRTDSA